MRNRRPTVKIIRQAVRQQLGYVRGGLSTIEALLAEGRELTLRQIQTLEIIRELYRQQKGMYDHRQHKADHRIVSISQPWVRSIVLGKATAEVELGAKVSLSVAKGFAFIERLDWEAYNEAETLKDAVEAYKSNTGHYPERLLADRINRTWDNMNFCKEYGIHFNGPRLDQPPTDQEEYARQKRLERLEAGERNAVEGKIGEGKRTYGCGRLTVRLKGTSEVSIYVTVLTMNIMKRLRVVFLFLEDWRGARRGFHYFAAVTALA